MKSSILHIPVSKKPLNVLPFNPSWIAARLITVRVTNQSGHKVPQKQVVANIGPLDRFDDGQPDYVARGI